MFIYAFTMAEFRCIHFRTGISSVLNTGAGHLRAKEPGAVLTGVPVPAATRDFSPRVRFQCRLSYGVFLRPAAVFVTLFCTAVEAASCRVHKVASHWRGPHLLFCWWQSLSSHQSVPPHPSLPTPQPHPHPSAPCPVPKNNNKEDF